MKKIFQLLLIVFMMFGCTQEAEPEIEEEPEPIGYSDTYVLLTYKDSTINELIDLKGKKIGFQYSYDVEDTKYIVEEIANELEITEENSGDYFVPCGNYQSIPDLVVNKEIDAWLVKEKSNELIEDYRSDYHANEFKVVKEFNVPIYEEVDKLASYRDKKLFTKPFAVMLQGLDERVKPNENNKARNDVNHLMIVDPVRRHILTISFPRDSYVYSEDLGYSCKLTEVGTRAKDANAVRKAIGDLLEMDIEYYAQVSFSSFVDLFTSLGGVWIDVPMNTKMDQNSYRDVAQPYALEKGYQKLYGEMALALARNRKYAGIYNGDYGRIRNQMLIINSICKKIANHPEVLDWAEMVWRAAYLADYNFTEDEVDTLFKLAEEFSKGYTVDNYFIDNTGGVLDSGAWVGYVIEDTRQIAMGKINLVMNGKIDKESKYYEDIIKGYVSKGTDTEGYLGEYYDLKDVYNDIIIE